MGSFFSYQRLTAPKIPKRWAVRHLPQFTSILLILFLWLPSIAQQSETVKNSKAHNDSYLTINDVNDIIHRYKQSRAADQVAVWSQWSRSASRAASPEFREAVIRNFPAAWLAQRSIDPDLDKKLDIFFQPLFSLYGKKYEIFLIDIRAPAILINSGAVMVMTTGLLSRTRNDDELFGFVAHEIAHAQFAQRSVAAKELYTRLAERKEKDSAGAREALKELSRIELECDAVTARTLSVMGFDPTQFVRSVERINEEFPLEASGSAKIGVDWHPPTSMRLLVVEALAEGEVLKRKPQMSKLLHGIQEALPNQSK